MSFTATLTLMMFYPQKNNTNNNLMNMFSIDLLISTAVRILIGWLLIDKVPYWLNLNGVIATIVKVIGVLIIIGALLSWV